MRNKAPWLFATAGLFMFTLALHASSSLAHPPDQPFDDDVFAPIGPGGFPIKLELVADGLTAPLKGKVAPGHANRLFVVDQAGILWAINLTTGAKTVFLDVSVRLVTLGVLGPGTFDERGFLGVAFHPDSESNGLLYTYTSEPTAGPPTFPTTLPPGSAPDHQNVIAEWRAISPGNPALGVDPLSRRELIRVDWPQFNHDAGDLAFGPDRMLFISMGDGGGADDQDGQDFIVATGSFPIVTAPMVGHQGDGNSQKLNTPLGKILRIDVDGSNSANGQYGIPADNPFVGVGPDVVEEIWALGFRNPYRFSFDSVTGRHFVGDVGQNDLEEVNVVVKGGNFGWNRKEGTFFFDPGDFTADSGDATEVAPGPVPPGLIDPIAQYDTHFEGHSVIGGFVYRGNRIPQLAGRYVFGEFSRLFRFPLGPDNFGRILYLQQKKMAGGKELLDVREVHGFAEEAARLGLTDPTAPPAAFPQSLSVLGMGEDASGEAHVLGNRTGRPFGTGGVVLRIAPVSRR
ncbi:MAG: PQQ-dependent sugar dehydrogenase [Candidatus Rokubacteria bacterium]|nr:PQQ-dependent sugar dehydrogenase [Candidatus Rokubacteria bacterium]